MSSFSLTAFGFCEENSPVMSPRHPIYLSDWTKIIRNVKVYSIKNVKKKDSRNCHFPDYKSLETISWLRSKSSYTIGTKINYSQPPPPPHPHPLTHIHTHYRSYICYIERIGLMEEKKSFENVGGRWTPDACSHMSLRRR